MGKHALVLGASMAGLLAARVLSDFYDRVTVVERDTLPAGAEQRRGVPQGLHVHGLLAAGAQSLNIIFPGILDELVRDGATMVRFDDAEAVWQIAAGHDLRFTSCDRSSELIAYQSTRPFLESHVRGRLRSCASIAILEGHDVVALASTAGQVTGARVAGRVDHGHQTLEADLVVDAMGRGSRTPLFLDDLGYGRPDEDSITMKLAYVSRLFHIPAPAPAEKLFLRSPEPNRPTGMALAKLENDIWILTVGGMVGRTAPTDWAEMMTFAGELAPPSILDILRRARPLEEPSRFRYPASQWRHYERMRRFPPGLLVLGDALCSFNPVYGQGMSVAALEALALRECLRDSDVALSRRFFREATKPVSVAWNLTAGADLALPEVPGRRTASIRTSAWYTEKLLTAATTDRVVASQFLRVTNLLDPPSRLMTPSILRRVLKPRNVQSTSKTDRWSSALR
jgi:2-polyprenyl-6-methoxyphenol hydroxylase-like FAD-dependent oxidoreductase